MIMQFLAAGGSKISQETANMVVPVFAGFIFGPVAFLPWLPFWSHYSFTLKLVTFVTLTVLYYLPLVVISRISFETSNILPQDTKIAKITRKTYLIINTGCSIAYIAICYFDFFRM